MKFILCAVIMMKLSLIVCSKPPCSNFEFLYKYEIFENGSKREKQICIMKCPFGCGYGDCQNDKSCECKMAATYLKHHKTREVEFDMCNLQCDQERCKCFNSWCYFGSQCVCNYGFSYDEELDCCMRDPGDQCQG